MNTYIVNSPSRTYKLTYLHGKVVKLEGEPDFTDKFWVWFLKGKFDLEENISKVDSKSIKVERMTVTFEIFWKKYDYKKDKQNAEKQWNKLKEEEQLAAYKGIDKYKRTCGGFGQPALVYPERYLKNRRWEDED